MQLVFPCPKCEETTSQPIEMPTSQKEILQNEALQNAEQKTDDRPVISCSQCDWSRKTATGDLQEKGPTVCLVCACTDLWRQKDFPPQLGLTMVALGAILSTIAWQMYYPVTALSILLVFAGIDLFLYWYMPDVLVCYHCEARHRGTNPEEDSHPRFDLEVAERYRQEAIRLEESLLKESLQAEPPAT